jgi:hypothetical protein
MTPPTTVTRVFTTAMKGGSAVVRRNHQQIRPDLTPTGAVAVRPATRWSNSAPGPGSAPPPPRSRAGVSRHTKDKQP